MKQSDWSFTLVGILCCGVALARAVRVPAPEDAPPLPDAAREEAFRYVLGEERALRDKAMESFIADAWSQDDDFHASERTRVHDFAAQRGVSRDSVWRAVDDGIRERWPLPGGGEVRPTVAPCRPRPIY